MLQIRLPLPRFVSAGEVFSGPGSLGALRALDASKAAVLVSPSVLTKHRGALERAIGAEALMLIEMPRGEPTLDVLTPILAQLETFQPDWIIAVGGGSVIDGAKSAWVLYEHPAVARDRLFRMGGVPTLRGKAKFAAAPTTAGTGSEVSSSALLIDSETGTKRALISHELLPDVVVLDPQLAIGCSPMVIAHAGLDALAHAVESYGSRLENTLADVLAEKAAAEIFSALPDYWRTPDDEGLAQRLMNAALLAGWVQNQKVPGIGHAIAHQLGCYGVAHGQATGQLLASAIRFNCGNSATRSKYDVLAAVLGFNNSAGLIDQIQVLVSLLEVEALPNKIHTNLGQITVGALEDPCARMNPRDVDAAAVAEVLEASR
ncbi:iron-containing alcohol dehydrogenase [Cerasicoccus arenae]|uniref:Alcohol dehydrogenase n=1 Tax=Cerasicoccus arenae TaxID=424488 RepID=A0A8J3GEM3_9BACT|nr:iron-containing alcohol dehydrogenase [Cerasicoccus arenae]MBK1858665.1 iron-containing alcohol dehydrogenase [Cerasicoccus arenae]GHC04720.1 alcohol dehydrogenase [Cerasicoccus arenae]